MTDPAPSRAQIAAELESARVAAEEAALRLHAAEAFHNVTSQPGLRYATVGPDSPEYVVGCDGQALGRMWRGPAGGLLHGWTCAPFGAIDRLGPFHTARAAAAGLAAACGVEPTHTMGPATT